MTHNTVNVDTYFKNVVNDVSGGYHVWKKEDNYLNEIVLDIADHGK